jgi:hypothetical protein
LQQPAIRGSVASQVFPLPASFLALTDSGDEEVHLHWGYLI